MIGNGTFLLRAAGSVAAILMMLCCFHESPAAKNRAAGPEAALVANLQR